MLFRGKTRYIVISVLIVIIIFLIPKIDTFANTSDDGKISFDTTYTPYYNSLNVNDKNAYLEIYNNIIDLSNTFKLNSSVKINNIDNIIKSIYNDHPELFYLDGTYEYKYKDDNVAYLTINYNDTIDDIDYYQALIDNKVNSIIEECNKMESDLEKEKYVHDTLINSITYDSSSTYSRSIYGGIVLGNCVCSGYARSFQYIMNKLGIETTYITGTSSNSNHAWNVIKIDNNYYNIDLTFDDVTSSLDYFNILNEDFTNHDKSELSEKIII